MEIKFDVFNQQEKPSITLCNPNYDELYSLNACYDTEVKLRWNSQSEFLFTFPRSINGTELDAFDFIEGKRVVYVEDLGYFIIDSVVEDSDGSVPIKRVTCLSQDSELVYKKILEFEGTYSLAQLMDLILSLAPEWSIDSIHANLQDLYRTFEVRDTNVYRFLTSDVSTSYDCVILFSYFEKTITIIPADYPPLETDVFLSYENLVKSTEYKEITNEITTCLYCYGGNNLNIRYVNPLGTNAIYNFDYFMTTDWMSQALIDAIEAWETKVESYIDEYKELLEELSEYQLLLLTYQAQLINYEILLASALEVRAVRIEQGLDTTDIDALIEQYETMISNQNVLIAQTEEEITNITSQITAINATLAFTNTSNFTTALYSELQNFIFENTYFNDNIITTESMTFAEIQEQSQQLYDIATEVLEKISKPRYEIEIDSVNLLALKEYEVFIEQLGMGNQITIDSGKGYYIDAVLLECEFSYENPESFKIIIGNRQRLSGSNTVFTDYFIQSDRRDFAVGIGSGGDCLFEEDLTGQVGATIVTTHVYVPESLRVWINGVRQRRNYTFSENEGYQSFTALDEILDNDIVIVDYLIDD
jgi:hypothetical protein